MASSFPDKVWVLKFEVEDPCDAVQILEKNSERLTEHCAVVGKATQIELILHGDTSSEETRQILQSLKAVSGWKGSATKVELPRDCARLLGSDEPVTGCYAKGNQSGKQGRFILLKKDNTLYLVVAGHIIGKVGEVCSLVCECGENTVNILGDCTHLSAIKSACDAICPCTDTDAALILLGGSHLQLAHAYRIHGEPAAVRRLGEEERLREHLRRNRTQLYLLVAGENEPLPVHLVEFMLCRVASGFRDTKFIVRPQMSAEARHGSRIISGTAVGSVRESQGGHTPEVTILGFVVAECCGTGNCEERDRRAGDLIACNLNVALDTLQIPDATFI